MPDTELKNRVWSALEERPVAMVTTAAAGAIRTRPMSGVVDREGHRILYVAHRHTGVVEEALASRGVSLAISDEDRNFYAALACTAAEIEDRALLERIWTPMAGAWFPQGPEDPDVTLLALEPVSAEIWDGPSSGMVVAFKLATARILGREPHLGVNATVDMREPAPDEKETAAAELAAEPEKPAAS